MNRQDVIKKAMIKLGMMGDSQDLIDNEDKQNILKRLWNERDPRKVIKDVQDLFVRIRPSKEAKQDLFKFFKLKGLFKRSLPYENMEKAWRLLLKENDLRGFLLEN